MTPHEAAFVDRGRALFVERFSAVDFDFEDAVWDVRQLEHSRHNRTNRRVHFRRHGECGEPLPARFGNVVKAFCLLELRSKAHLLMRVAAARVLWEAVLVRSGSSEAFSWDELGEADFLAAEQRMLTRWKPSTTYVACNALQRMIEVLSGAGLMPLMRVPFRTPKQEVTERYVLAQQAERTARLPSAEALNGVADIFARLACEPADRLLACVLALLVASGLRVGEVLTLPENCLVSEGQGEHRMWGLRFNKEKSSERRRVLETRWLTPMQSELARGAVHEAQRLTAAARERARVLEAHPNTVPLPNFSWHAELTSQQLGTLMGLHYTAINNISSSKLPRRVIPVPRGSAGAARRRAIYRAADVRAYLHSERSPLWVIDRGDGTRQALSETLFIAYRYALAHDRGTNPLLVDMLTEQHVNDFLGTRSPTASQQARCTPRSAFERFDIREKNGSIVRMSSHGFRHWVTTRAAAAGVDDATLARWQNREHAGDLQRYKHLTSSERVAVLKAALRRGQLRGWLAEMYFSLVDDVRDVFLEDQLQAVHVTTLGLCIHDFKISPCPKALNCVKFCRDFLHDTTDAGQRQQLIQLEARVGLVLDQAQRQQAVGEDDLAESWVAEAEETRAGIRAILATAPQPGAPLIQPFSDRPSRFEPLENC
jgi:hypothetical protein